MNGERRTQEEVGALVKQYAKLYSNLKFSQEVETSNMNVVFKSEMDELTQDVREEGVSKQFLEYNRCNYEKSLKLNEIEVNIKDNSIETVSEFIFNSIINSMDNNSNSADFYRDLYLSAKDSIIKYYTRYFEIKQEKQKLKDKHAAHLGKLVTDIKEDGLAFYMIPAFYKELRHKFKTKQTSPSEFFYYEEILNEIKDEILNDFENISSARVDSKTKINCEISREEAIERIEYIKYNVDVQNYGILKEEWTKSEYKEFATNIEEKCKDITKFYNFYTKNYNELSECSDENLLKILDVPGIRLLKRHQYIIR